MKSKVVSIMPYLCADAPILSERKLGVVKVKHTCPSCNETWMAEMYYELGGWIYTNMDDMFCLLNCEDEPMVEESN